ncbi:MAG: hypothetical protein M1829_004959 [Trizodia sp. TS-e1964]|nr:MAG: hypothetical protein M1829_004959 [Trizodia sp. TS-e1964]
MSSSVFFKFKSQKDPSRVAFDGTGISVFELKRSIIEINKLGDGTDFDLCIYNQDTNEEYNDDTTIIPRSTSIIARRLPPPKPGHGRAARYVSGRMATTPRGAPRTEAQSSKLALQMGKSKVNTVIDASQTEEERIAAMFKQGAEQWNQQKQELASVTPIHRGPNPKGKPGAQPAPSHPPPPGYICYRCAQKGHWIQACPTNNDPNFDNRPRIKRTTGIPRSFLKTVEKPTMLSNDGTTDGSHQPSGVMVNAEGEYVVAEPDQASWELYQAKTKVSAAAKEAEELGSKELRDLGLECSIDKRLFVEPMKTPCCGRTYCNDCITNALVESDLTCPGCDSDGILIDNLVSNDEVALKITKYIEAKEIARIEKEKSKSPPVEKAKPVTPNSTQKTPSKSPEAKKNAPSPLNPIKATKSPQKRPAEEELENTRVAPGPSASSQTTNAVVPPILKQKTPGFQQNFNIGDQFSGNLLAQPGMGQMGQQMGFLNGNSGYLNMGMMPNTLGSMNMNNSMMGAMMMGRMNLPLENFNAQSALNFPQPQQMGMYGNGNGVFPNGMPHNNSNNGYTQQMMMPQMAMGQMGSNINLNMGLNHGMSHGINNGMNNGMNAGGKGPVVAAMRTGMQQPQGMNLGPNPNIFSNQQKTVFAEPFPNEEDNAYFRKPVNPHRHQARQRRVRPSDYREL